MTSQSDAFTASFVGAVSGAGLVLSVSFLQKRFNPTASSSSQILLNELQQSLKSLQSNINTSINSSITTSTSQLLPQISSSSTAITTLASEVASLNTVFNNPKTRGVFGEIQLESVVRDCFPSSSYSFQTSLPTTSTIPDCTLNFPAPLGSICVDSKFPLNAYLELQAAGDSSTSTLDARKRMQTHLLSHIKAVHTKYIIPGVTGDSAILFIPSETIFNEIIEHFPHVMAEAQSKKVWITSPNTLMALLTSMRGLLRNANVAEKATAIFSEFDAVMLDVDRLLTRSSKVEKQFDLARESLRLMEVSVEKVRRRGLALRSLEQGMFSSNKETNLEP